MAGDGELRDVPRRVVVGEGESEITTVVVVVAGVAVVVVVEAVGWVGVEVEVVQKRLKNPKHGSSPYPG